MRVCKKCGVEKAHSEFYRDKSVHDGLRAVCKACLATERAVNPEPARKRALAWHYANHDRSIKSHREYHADNRERLNARSKRYRTDNFEQCSQSQRDWRKKNADRKHKNDLAWHEANPGKMKQYRKVSQGKRRAKIKSGDKITAEYIDQLYDLQNGICPACRKQLGDDYHIDHIKALSKGGTHTKRNIQLLCAPCNRRKHTKPHEVFMQEMGFLI